MKRKTLSALLFLSSAIVLVMSSCKKDDPAPTPSDPAHVGLWKGKYGNTTNYPNAGYAMLLRNNGTVRVFDGTDTATASKAEGTYTISGTTVNSTYSYLPSGPQYSTTATLNSKTTFMEGTWGPGTTPSGSGKFYLVKE
ncbi:MAG: hypothetical protein U0V75_13275 [Ferruginibacter sp.]